MAAREAWSAPRDVFLRLARRARRGEGTLHSPDFTVSDRSCWRRMSIGDFLRGHAIALPTGSTWARPPGRGGKRKAGRRLGRARTSTCSRSRSNGSRRFAANRIRDRNRPVSSMHREIGPRRSSAALRSATKGEAIVPANWLARSTQNLRPVSRRRAAIWARPRRPALSR